MNIARFGVEIDPNPAADGSRKIIIEVKQIGQEMDKTADKAKKTGDAFGKLMKLLAIMAAPIIAIIAAVKALAGAFDFLKSAVQSASDMEGFLNQWAFMLGSFDKAKAKMKELADYANASPFDLPGVTKTALGLAKLKDTGMETMAGLKLVGDAAAAAGQPIEEVGTRIVKMLNNLKRGGGAGDEASALGEWQIFSPELVGRLQDMGDKAGNFKVLLADIKKELAAADGATKLMETSWKGMMSTLGDKWNTFKAALGQPIMTGLKAFLDGLMPLIDDMTKIITGWTPKVGDLNKAVEGLAPEIQRIATMIPAAFRVLQSDNGFRLAMKASIDWLFDYIRRLLESLKPVLKSLMDWTVYWLKTGLHELGKPSFWQGMFDAITEGVKAAIRAAAPVMASLSDAIYDPKGMKGRYDDIKAKQAREDKMNEVPIMDRLRALKQAQEKLPEGYTAKLAYGPDGGAYVKTGPSADPTWQEPEALGLDTPTIPGEPDASLFPEAAPPPELQWTPPELQTPDEAQTEAQKTFGGRFQTAMNDINAWLAKTKLENELLVQQKKAERDKKELEELSKPHVETEDEKKERLEKIVPGTDMSFKEAQSYGEKLTEKAMSPEEEYNAEISKINALRDAKILSEEQYQKVIASTTQAYTDAQEKRTAASEKAAVKEQTAMQKLMGEWGNLTKQIDQASVGIMTAISDNITGAIVAMAEGTKSASEAFGDMAKGIMSSILQIITRLVVQYALMAAMGMATGVKVPSFSSFSMGNLSGGGSNAAVMHSGGIVGESGTSRSVAAGTFDGAQRFHSGGVIGANEVPIIAERGEQVLTKDQQMDLKSRLSGSGREQAGAKITIVNAVSPDEIRSYITQNPDVILNVLSSQGPKVREIVRA